MSDGPKNGGIKSRANLVKMACSISFSVHYLLLLLGSHYVKLRRDDEVRQTT